MKKGYDVFGKAYGVMLRNDLHAVSSIDHQLLQKMILLNEKSQTLLYGASPIMQQVQILLIDGSI